MKNLSSILALGLLIFVSLACNFSVGKTGVVSIESVALAKNGGGKPGETVSAFAAADETQYFVATLNEGKTGTRVKGVFTVVNAGGETNQKIAETEIVTVDDDQNKVNFHITLPDGFPAGDYKADFYLNDQLAKTTEYKVQ